VNGQLWTIPFELQCYVAITALAMAGVTRNSKAFLTLVFGLLGGCVFLFLRGHDRDIGSIPGHQLVVCFLIGVMMYKFRSNIPHNIRLFLVALAAALVCFWVPGGGLLSLLPVAYVTVFLGLLNPPKLAVLQTGDYSYGIFLYGFPIQQAVVASGLVPLNGWLTLLAAIPFILLVAVLSWHLWEKKMLELRCFRPTIDRNFGFTRPGLLKDRIFAISRARDGS
jgi:peptidoglycan/LPS O-acetylase OafA/YrhL